MDSEQSTALAPPQTGYKSNQEFRDGHFHPNKFNAIYGIQKN
jgi:hypothetical protein